MSSCHSYKTPSSSIKQKVPFQCFLPRRLSLSLCCVSPGSIFLLANKIVGYRYEQICMSCFCELLTFTAYKGSITALGSSMYSIIVKLCLCFTGSVFLWLQSTDCQIINNFLHFLQVILKTIKTLS